jgi:hypothetical protein
MWLGEDVGAIYFKRGQDELIPSSTFDAIATQVQYV